MVHVTVRNRDGSEIGRLAVSLLQFLHGTVDPGSERNGVTHGTAGYMCVSIPLSPSFQGPRVGHS